LLLLLLLLLLFIIIIRDPPCPPLNFFPMFADNKSESCETTDYCPRNQFQAELSLLREA